MKVMRWAALWQQTAASTLKRRCPKARVTAAINKESISSKTATDGRHLAATLPKSKSALTVQRALLTPDCKALLFLLYLELIVYGGHAFNLFGDRCDLLLLFGAVDRTTQRDFALLRHDLNIFRAS